jgi:hypothetical protein
MSYREGGVARGDRQSLLFFIVCWGCFLLFVKKKRSILYLLQHKQGTT